MTVRNLHRGLLVVVGAAAIVGLINGYGCAQETNEKAQKLELKFDLTKCQPLSPGLYKCPAIDKPICTTEYNQPGVECVRIGKKGSVFVMGPGGMMGP
ncbi:MAG: hypothetical protein JO121_23145 [Deltaproteobacteria bacterium]|jgi:hypothetical protein|nr:hypothetical protein [Deltaproteobacteria bacterium]